MKKRENYISWDEYFMGIAYLSAMRSKDPNTQIGACIVNNENKIVGTGYNGFPIGCCDEKLPWNREGKKLETKYPFVVHAEANAILNSTQNLKGCRLFVGLFPCNECAKLIIQSKINEVIFVSDKYADLDEFKASRKLLQMGGIKIRQFIPKNEELTIEMKTD
jgi:dCMP deaminase